MGHTIKNYKEHDLRYYFCQIDDEIDSLNQKLYNIQDENACLATTNRFINALRSHYKQKKFKRQSEDQYAVELSAKSMTESCQSMMRAKSRRANRNSDKCEHSLSISIKRGSLSPFPCLKYVPLCNQDDDEKEKRILTSFERIDRAMGLYYWNLGKNKKYFDADNKGKFLLFVLKNGFDEDAIEQELGDNVDANDSKYIAMDCDFPLFPFVNKKDRQYAIFNV